MGGIRVFAAAAAGAFALAGALMGRAAAEPILQLYIEGAEYDAATETWILQRQIGDPLRLWAIGNTGKSNPISNVRIAAAYSQADITGPVNFIFTPTTTGGLGGFTDPSTPAAPAFLQTVSDGSVPLLTDGGSLPSHGIYGAGVEWQEFLLGDFTLEDSPLSDFINTFPAPNKPGEAQINVYDISISGLGAGAFVHFDLYDSVQSGNKARSVFAPFSHDAGNTVVPTPGSLGLLALGLIGAGAALRRRRR
ncbi:MAG: hypothetical protein Tsb0010_19650 [Parvularculaceae bacterium]